MSSFASSLPSSNTIHMSTIVSREVVGTNDWRDYGARLVMDVDSQRDRKKGLYNGSRIGSIVFNYSASHYGGICLLGYDSNQGFCQEGDGSVSSAKNVLFNSRAQFASSLSLASAAYNIGTSWVSGQGTILVWNTVRVGRTRTEFVNVDPINGNGGFDFYDTNNYSTIRSSTPMFTLSPSETVFNVSPQFRAGASFSSGQQIRLLNSTNNPALTIYSDEGGDMNLGTQVADGANIRNVNGFYGRNLTVTQKISASQLHIQLSTPSSSSASCSAGDIKDDANYHYVCVATNKWKRVALSDF
ncbi:hypothetical protein [Commensalibacter oyaizuii]|uniref:Uncharacterized protein n=1 Tax=Commensalibacter oyaizuii TaxID=3043873 RepID=A0ABT6Q4P1_9PROT|nr:hypothetical protein [Commensalibacter sp. TBRC 16381]MDI2091469.1 hypothetical protein [Commensalibacter sp. TBRC 16381]